MEVDTNTEAKVEVEAEWVFRPIPLDRNGCRVTKRLVHQLVT